MHQETQASGAGPPMTAIPPPPRQRAGWVIAVCLAIIATCLVLRLDEGPALQAQPVAQAGARGIFAFTGQLTKGTYGVFMVDVDVGTLWCYEYVPGKRELRLVAARSWKYDRYLEEFNVEESTSPAEIERLVEEQRARKLQSMGTAP